MPFVSFAGGRDVSAPSEVRSTSPESASLGLRSGSTSTRSVHPASTTTRASAPHHRARFIPPPPPLRLLSSPVPMLARDDRGPARDVPAPATDRDRAWREGGREAARRAP